MDKFEDARKIEAARLLTLVYKDKNRLPLEESDVNSLQWAGLLGRLPPAVKPLEETAQRAIASKDAYRIAWLGLKVKALYQGVAIDDYLPGSWDDEADFLSFLRTL